MKTGWTTIREAEWTKGVEAWKSEIRLIDWSGDNVIARWPATTIESRRGGHVESTEVDFRAYCSPLPPSPPLSWILVHCRIANGQVRLLDWRLIVSRVARLGSSLEIRHRDSRLSRLIPSAVTVANPPSSAASLRSSLSVDLEVRPRKVDVSFLPLVSRRRDDRDATRRQQQARQTFCPGEWRPRSIGKWKRAGGERGGGTALSGTSHK